jgi:hypothetical protein
MDTSAASNTKLAETLSVMGAGILGAGLALWWREWLGGFAVHFLVAGVLAHGVGMALRRRLEPPGDPRPRWITWLYVICWIALAAIVAARALA